jgi:hypothetical protein
MLLYADGISEARDNAGALYSQNLSLNDLICRRVGG